MFIPISIPYCEMTGILHCLYSQYCWAVCSCVQVHTFSKHFELKEVIKTRLVSVTKASFMLF